MLPSLTPRTLAIFLVAALIAVPLLNGMAQADGGAAREPVSNRGPHFITSGLVGEGTQTALLAIPWTSATPDGPTPATVGYTSLVIQPHTSLLGGVGLSNLVEAVSACASVAVETEDAPAAPCHALTKSASCESLSSTSYCIQPNEPAAGRVSIHFGTGQTALRVALLVAKQPAPGTIGNGVELQYGNDAWRATYTAVEVVSFETGNHVIAALRILTGAGGAGDEPTQVDTTTDPTHTFYAAGFDKQDRFAGDQAGTQWSVAPEGFVTLSRTAGESVVVDPVKPGAATLTATLGDLRAALVMNVTVGDVSTVVIRDAAQGQGEPVGDVEMRVEEAKQLFAAGYDADENFVDDQEADWVVLPPERPCGRITTEGAAAVIEATRPSDGACRAQATTSGASDETGRITVLSGQALLLNIYDASGELANDTTLTTSDELRLFASVVDVDGNRYPPTSTVMWSVVNGCGALNATTGDRVTFDATKKTGAVATGGDCRVMASLVSQVPAATPTTANHMSAGQVAWTGKLTVTPGEITSVKIRSAANGGGVEIGAPVWGADEPQTLFAAGYDADFNFVKDIAGAEWTTSDATVGALSALIGASVSFDPDVPGTTILSIEAEDLVDSTGTISVVVGALDELRIRDAAENDGNVVGDLPLPAGSTKELWAAGYDLDDNYRGDEQVSWSVINGCGIVDPAFGPTTVFTAGGVSHHDCRIKAEAGGASATTGRIGIQIPSVSRLELRDGGEQTVTGHSRSAGITLHLYAAGYDSSGNFLGNQSGVAWSASPIGGAPCGTFNNATGGATIFTPTRTGDCTVTGSLAVGASTVVDDTGVIVVRPGAIHHVNITGAPATTRAGAAFSDDVTVTILDVYDNVNTTFHQTGGKVQFSLQTPGLDAANEALPAQYVFQAADGGVKTFPGSSFKLAKFGTSGPRVLRVTPANSTATYGTAAGSVDVVVTPADLGSFTVDVAGFATPTARTFLANASVDNAVTIKALDVYGNPKHDYVGTVSFDVSPWDSRATVPADASFTPEDDGEIVVDGTWKFLRAGANRFVTSAVDDPTKRGESTLTATIQQLAAVRLVVTLPGETYDSVNGTVSGTPTTATAGAAYTPVVRAVDQFGNVLTGATGLPNRYTGDKSLVFSGAVDGWDGTKPTAKGRSGATDMPVAFGGATPTTFASGTGEARPQLILARDVEQSFTVTDPTGLVGSSSTFSVKAGAAKAIALLHDDCGTESLDRACIIASETHTAPWAPTVGTEYHLVAYAVDDFDNLIAPVSVEWAAPDVSPAFVAVGPKVIWTPGDTTAGHFVLSEQDLTPLVVDVAPVEG